MALLPGSAASVWAYRAGLGPVGPVSLRALLVTTIAGGALGALLLLKTPSSAFDIALPWLLLFATCALIFGRMAGEWLRRNWKIRKGPVLVIQFLLGVYGGYFGGAVGLMMLAVWGLVTNQEIKVLNAPRTLLVTAANSVAVIIFIAARAVYWRETVTMLVAAIGGGYGGALAGRRLPSKVARGLTIGITIIITITFFVRTYR